MKNALVISGGGSKGAFAVGAIEKLRDAGIEFQVVSGTSTGSLIAPLVVTDEIQLLRSMYTSVTTQDIIRERPNFEFLLSDSIYDTNPVWSLINSFITPARYDEIMHSTTELYLTTVDLQSGEIVYWTQPTRNYKHIDSREVLMRAMLASASMPVFMPDVQINPGGHQYVDGGVREIAPFKVVIDNGATDIYSIVLSPENPSPSEKRYNNIPETLLRVIELFEREIVENDIETAVLYNRAISYIRGVNETAKRLLSQSQYDQIFNATQNPDPFIDKRLMNLWIIRPDHELPASTLEFSPFIMSQMMAMGRQAAENALNRSPLIT
ncbi:MAG: hypothetical protein ILNGONEN_01997 [Syntrophorhabdaceae bacterium]|nr:hypothetical protein [Syntrophorhabdaceae bacterium]